MREQIVVDGLHNNRRFSYIKIEIFLCIFTKKYKIQTPII